MFDRAGMKLPNTLDLFKNLTNTDDIKMGSEKAFGLVFAVVFLVVALLPLTAEDGEDAALKRDYKDAFELD